MTDREQRALARDLVEGPYDAGFRRGHDGGEEAADVLELDAATKRFGPLAALDSCSFVARPGRLTGFLGPNGAGKTTAMRAVFGLVALDSGSISWQGAPLGPAVRRRFGYMPEERGLYPRMRVRDQLVYFGTLSGASHDDARRSVDRWLGRLGLTARADDRLDALSHGNQQRVQLIAALVDDPELLVLDEPFSGLDPLAMASMCELLTEVAAQGVAVLFSSHQLDLVEDICEDVVIIDAGHVVCAGVLDDLRAQHPHRIVQLRYRGAPPDWRRFPGATVVSAAPGSARLVVDAHADLPSLVAMTAGLDLLSLSYEPPTLSDLFRQAVGA